MPRDYAHGGSVPFSLNNENPLSYWPRRVAWMLPWLGSRSAAVTREDDGRDTRISNWTLATGTLPGRPVAGTVQEVTS